MVRQCYQSKFSLFPIIRSRTVGKKDLVVLYESSFTYKNISSTLLLRLTQYAVEIIGDHQCGFRRNRSNTIHIFCIRKIPDKNGNTSDLKKLHDSTKNGILYYVLIELGITLSTVSNGFEPFQY
jgi:hypothetical protein